MFVTIDLDDVLIQNPFALGVMPAVRRRLARLVRSEWATEQDRDRWLMDRIQGRSAERMRRGDWVGAYDWDAIINEVAREIGYTDLIDVTGLVREYCRPPYIAAFPDARPGLAWLRRAADSVWWISNGFARYQVPVIEALGLDDQFDGYFAPDTHGSIKPFSPLFEAAAAAAREAREAGVHIGDRLTHDVAGARRSGLHAVWLDRCLPPVFRDASPWALPQAETFQTYVRHRALQELYHDAYGLDMDRDCRPDAVIWSLDQLPGILDG